MLIFKENRKIEYFNSNCTNSVFFFFGGDTFFVVVLNEYSFVCNEFTSFYGNVEVLQNELV